MMDILETLKKVEKSLDLRFEKDTSLYISKDDIEKIKEALFKSNFQNVNAFTKKLGNRVVAKVILSNSWLINFNKNKSDLTKIFDSIDKNFLRNISKEIVEDNIFSTIEFKSFIESYYIETISLSDCKKMYKNEDVKIENRVIAFERYLKDDYIKNNSVSNSIRFIDQELKNIIEIENYVQNKRVNFLTLIFKDSNEKDILTEWIIENKLTDRKDKIWNNLFLSLEDSAFDMSIEYISNYPSWDNKITKHLIQRVLKSFSNNSNFKHKIAELYGNNYSIRKLFIHMIEPPKFRDEELANSLLDYFESVELPNNSENSVEMIRNWKAEEKGFKNLEDLISQINKNGQDFKNNKTLNYYSMQLGNTDKNIILELYNKFKDEKDVVLVISYYLVNFLRKREIPKYFKSINSEIYINKITKNIEKLHINTIHSKSFLEDNGKYELLAKFNQR